MSRIDQRVFSNLQKYIKENHIESIQRVFDQYPKIVSSHIECVSHDIAEHGSFEAYDILINFFNAPGFHDKNLYYKDKDSNLCAFAYKCMRFNNKDLAKKLKHLIDRGLNVHKAVLKHGLLDPVFVNRPHDTDDRLETLRILMNYKIDNYIGFDNYLNGTYSCDMLEHLANAWGPDFHSIVNLFIDHGVDFNKKTNRYGEPFIFDAMKRMSHENVKLIFDHCNIDIKAVDQNYLTVLDFLDAQRNNLRLKGLYEHVIAMKKSREELEMLSNIVNSSVIDEPKKSKRL